MLVPVTDYPLDADIHIGVGDTPYTILDASVPAQLSTCTTVPAPARGTDYQHECQSGASGRYVYMYTHGVPGENQLNIYEFQIYGDPAVVTRM